MATTLYFRGDSAGAKWTHGQVWTNLAGLGQSGWLYSSLDTSAGSGSYSLTANTVAGTTNGVEFGSPHVFVTDPFSSDTTISGQMTINLYASENSMSANAAINIMLYRLLKDGSVSMQDNALTRRTTELGTSIAVQNWNVTPTSFTVYRGERLGVVVYIDDAGTMASGYTATFQYGGTGDYDSYVTFTETLSFEGSAAGYAYLLTDTDHTAGHITANSSYTHKVASITAGSSAVTVSGTTANGPVTEPGWVPQQNSKYLDWFTEPLAATTLSGPFLVTLWGYESNAAANATFTASVYVTNYDGTSEVLYGRNTSTTELGTSSGSLTFKITGSSVSIPEGGRLRFIVGVNDAYGISGGGAQAGPYTAYLKYNYTQGNDGGSFFQTPAILSPSSTKRNFVSANAVIKATRSVSPSLGSFEEPASYVLSTAIVSNFSTDGATYAAVDANGLIHHTDNPSGNWYAEDSNIPSDPTEWIYYHAYSGLWVAGGAALSGIATATTTDGYFNSWTTNAITGGTSYLWAPSWTEPASSISDYRYIYRIDGSGGLQYSSTPSSTWTTWSSPPSQIKRIVYGGGKWVAATLDGKIYTATSLGGTWTQNSTTVFGTYDVQALAYGAGYWVAGNANGVIATAVDPTGTWTSRTNPTSYLIGSFAYCNGNWFGTPHNGANYVAPITATGAPISWSQTSYTGPARKLWRVDGLVHVGGYGEGYFLYSTAGVDYTLYGIYQQKTSRGTTFLADAIIGQSQGTTQSNSFTADATIKKAQSASFTADSAIKGTKSSSFTADAAIKKTQQASFTADSTITKRTSVSFTADAYIRKTQSSSITADATIKKTQSTSFTADAAVKKTQQASFTADAQLKKSVSTSFTADANIKATSSTSFTADAYIRKTQSSSFTADASIAKTQSASFTADAAIKNAVAASITADSHIVKRQSSSFTADAYVKKTQSASFTADANIVKTQSASFTADAAIKAAVSGSFTANANIKATVATSFTADAQITGGVTTQSASFTADAVIKKTTSSSITADAMVKKTQSSSITADATVKKKQSASITADAYVKKTQSSSVTADARIVKRTSSSFTADAQISANVQTYSASFTADATIKKVQSASITADAAIKKTQSASITVDAYIRKTYSTSFTADAVVKAIRSASFTADASIFPVSCIWVSPAHGANTNDTTPEFVFTSVSSTGAVHFNMQLDTADTFDTGNLRNIRSVIDQTGWEYWDGSVWQSLPASGMPSNKTGNNVRYTPSNPLSQATWYRRVRQGGPV